MQADTHQFASPGARTSSTFISNAVDGNCGVCWAICPGTPEARATASETQLIHDGYTLERLILDLNGIEPVPAVLLIPDRRQELARGCSYWHAGQYDLGKEQLLRVQACNRRMRRFAQKKAW